MDSEGIPIFKYNVIKSLKQGQLYKNKFLTSLKRKLLCQVVLISVNRKREYTIPGGTRVLILHSPLNKAGVDPSNMPDKDVLASTPRESEEERSVTMSQERNLLEQLEAEERQCRKTVNFAGLTNACLRLEGWINLFVFPLQGAETNFG